jgi:hippurate hydrolase
MLQAKPGCYIWLGGGRGPDTPLLHNPHYDFNDDLIPLGGTLWIRMVDKWFAQRR